MTGATQRILGHLAALLPPALVLLLLGVQVAFGLRGFDRPDETLLYVLQVPGVLLGWGGVALLVPLLAWMIMDWWGYDLNGFALKGLGSAVLGIAFGALLGIGGGVAAGGLVGSGLATVLVGTLGTSAAVILLLVMAGPAGVLALSMQRMSAPAARAKTSESRKKPASDRRGLRLPRFFRRTPTRIEGESSSAWYPERHYDSEGNELPLKFGTGRDVSGIRYADEPVESDTDDAPEERTPAAVDAESAEAEDAERLPTIPELLSGQFDVSQLDAARDGSVTPVEVVAQAEDDTGPVHVDGEGRMVTPSRPTPQVTVPEQPVTFVPLPTSKPASEPPLPPGVRYVDDPAEKPETPAEATTEDGEATPEGAEASVAETTGPGVLSQAVREAVRGPSRTSHDTAVASSGEAMRRTLRERFDAFRTTGSNERYLAKLEASGIFDDIGPAPEHAEGVVVEPGPPEEAVTPAAAQPGSGSRKKAARKARKKATPKKKAAAKKKTAAGKKSARKKTAPKTAGKKPAETATRKRPRAQASASPARPSARLEGIRQERHDPLFVQAVDAAIERGAATPVLYARRLGMPYDRARTMLDRLVDLGILGEPTATGAHPVQMSQDEWEATQ